MIKMIKGWAGFLGCCENKAHRTHRKTQKDYFHNSPGGDSSSWMPVPKNPGSPYTFVGTTDDFVGSI
jgi:hypothetical protein